MADLKCLFRVQVEQMLFVQEKQYDAWSAVWCVLLKAQAVW